MRAKDFAEVTLAFMLAGSAQSLGAQAPLVKYVVGGDRIDAPLTAVAGDPTRGKQTALGRDAGNCQLCHQIPDSGLPVMGNIASSLAGIAMGLGGYLAAKTDMQHYDNERLREIREVEEVPEKETQEIADVFTAYGLQGDHLDQCVRAICSDKTRWVDFMMRFELGLDEPNRTRARVSATTIAMSYIVGGVIPLSPYIFLGNIMQALWLSIAVTLTALLVFGIIKGKFMGISPFRGGLQTLLIGGLAAAAAFLIAKMIS